MTAEDTPLHSRNARQSSVLPEAALRFRPAVVIGVGAVGRPTAEMLSGTGLRQIDLWDFDTVEEVNIGNQGYRPSDVGKHKAEACKDLCSAKAPSSEIRALVSAVDVSTRLMRESPEDTAVFCCVDKMSARRAIATSCRTSGVGLFVDTRMLGDDVWVFGCRTPEDYDAYLKELFSDEEAEPGRCGNSSNVYASNLAASLAVKVWTMWLRDIRTPKTIAATMSGFSIVADF